MLYRVKNWSDFQHYKDRSPSWVKLHKSLLDDYEFQCLPVASRALAPMLWLLASEHNDPSSGVLSGDHKKIAFRLRMTEREVADAIKPLLNAGFIEVPLDASKPLAEAEQNSSPEKETYREEKETERENIITPATPSELVPKAKRLITMPTDWKPHDEHNAKCRELRFDSGELGEEFRNYHLSKASKFADWDRAFFTWIGNAQKFGGNKTGRGSNQPAASSITEIGLRVADRMRRDDEQRLRNNGLQNRPQSSIV